MISGILKAFQSNKKIKPVAHFCCTLDTTSQKFIFEILRRLSDTSTVRIQNSMNVFT